MNFLQNLERWQKVAAGILVFIALWNAVPTSWKFMTRGQHEDDTNFTTENIAVRNISYYLKQICLDLDTPDDRKQLQRNFIKYEQATKVRHYYESMGHEERCKKVLRR